MSETFQQGWHYYCKTAQAGLVANAGQKYCQGVENAIDAFTSKMYEMVEKHGELGVGQCKGFVAEVWHAYTFNIDAKIKGSNHFVSVDESTGLGSVDGSTNFGKSFSMKYKKSAKASAEAQAKDYYDSYAEYLTRRRKKEPMSFEEYLQKNGIENNPEQLLKSVYDGQYRVIPAEQLEAAKKHLSDLMEEELKKTGPNRYLVYKKYLEAFEKLVDRIADDEGVESYILNDDSAKAIVELCKTDKFKPEDFGIELSKLIETDYILEQALKSGYTAAIMSFVMEFAPKVCELIIQLIKNGEIESEEFKTLGFEAIKSSANGFVRGYISSALTIACRSGKLGKEFMKITGNEVAAIVVLVMETVKNAFLVAAGKMTGREMSMKTEDAAIVTIAALVGGAIGIVFLPQIAVFGYMIGSLIGGVIGSLVAQGKNSLIMALCEKTGITLFGIVDQDYTLSKEMIDSLGLKYVDLKVNKLKRNELKYNQVNMVDLKKNELNTIDFFILRRGVVGVRRIGYV